MSEAAKKLRRKTRPGKAASGSQLEGGCLERREVRAAHVQQEDELDRIDLVLIVTSLLLLFTVALVALMSEAPF
ncbi:hypothetical protein [Bradyrhizobium sp. USDA 3364]